VKKPEYFPVLDSMRFVASLFVLLSHSVAFFDFPGAHISFGIFLNNAGYYGVIFFYALSGFLITFLLVEEKDGTGTIGVSRFYIRRALRIWPIYYLMVGLAFFVLRYVLPDSYAHVQGSMLLPFVFYLFLLPNVAAVAGFYLPTCFHLYTIGFEEQFYLVWPLLIKKFCDRPGYMLAVAFFLPLLVGIVHSVLHTHSLLPAVGWGRVLRGGLTFVDLSNIPAFAAGGAGAFVFLRRRDMVSKVMGSPIWGFALLLTLAGCMCWGRPWAIGYVNVLAIIFVLLMLHLIIRLSSQGGVWAFFSSGGKISYGIYVYHPAVLLLVTGYMTKHAGLFRGSPVLAYSCYLILSFAVVILVAGLSYVTLERVFIRMKRR
jgi:peptidoglycan/LPS O-acetylase OafA/YrhL